MTRITQPVVFPFLHTDTKPSYVQLAARVQDEAQQHLQSPCMAHGLIFDILFPRGPSDRPERQNLTKVAALGPKILALATVWRTPELLSTRTST